MDDQLNPLNLEQLAGWIGREYRARGSIVGIPGSVFWDPGEGRCRYRWFGSSLESPLGVAAGPHSQMAQNIAAAYLCGARVLELKTVQILDRLRIPKPCIDMRDVGFNCEWSQELSLAQTRAQYEDAWVLIHALAQVLGYRSSGVSFVLSVGYDLAGIQSKEVVNFLGAMKNASSTLSPRVEKAAMAFKKVGVVLDDLKVPEQISNTITLSTMHGCPPEEIERIGRFLIDDLGWNTLVKVNPTMLGAHRLRHILHGEQGFTDINVPDEAFEKDPSFDEMVDIIKSLQSAAWRLNRHFGVKLTNTLQTKDVETSLQGEVRDQYMSGRALHPTSVALAQLLAEQFDYEVPMSFSGGADAWNAVDLIASGLGPVTACSDLLRPGGYGRLSQYGENLTDALEDAEAVKLSMLPLVRAVGREDSRKRFASELRQFAVQKEEKQDLDALLQMFETDRKKAFQRALDWLPQDAGSRRHGARSEQIVQRNGIVRVACRVNLEQYAREVIADPRYAKIPGRRTFKSSRKLDVIDCTKAPCLEACPLEQRVPDYVRAVAEADYDGALAIILEDNPLPGVTGAVCDHPCQSQCVRQFYDDPVAIRAIKRFAASGVAGEQAPKAAIRSRGKVGIVGAGPCGLAAAFFCRRLGFSVTVYDSAAEAGGLVRRVIPRFRLESQMMSGDFDRVINEGVDFRFGCTLGQDISLERMRRENDYVFLAVGAGIGRRLRIPGEDAPGVLDGIEFLTSCNQGEKPDIGEKVIVIGGGNSAVDVARQARAQLLSPTGTVTIVYRRTREEMPAAREELLAAIEEGVIIEELLTPARVITDDEGRAKGLECLPMELGAPDQTGRRRPVPANRGVVLKGSDTIIVAIGQDQVHRSLGQGGLGLESDGRIKVDGSLGTNLEGVFAGGDAVRGPSTVAQAIGDARSFSLAILSHGASKEPAFPKKPLSESDLVRLFRAKSRRVPSAMRAAFQGKAQGTNQSASPSQVAEEAARCLSCGDLCALCVTVCPNRANVLFEVETGSWEIPNYAYIRGNWAIAGKETLTIRERYQVANVADLCNACGNCVVFCPTAGSPFLNKVRILRSDVSPLTEKRGTVFVRSSAGWIIEQYGNPHLRVKKEISGYKIFAKDFECRLGKDFAIQYVSRSVDSKPNEIINVSEGIRLARLGEGIGAISPF